MFTINLHNLQFFAYHGVHEEERILGNDFEVNVSIVFATVEPIKALEQTVNYAAVYDIVKQRMAVPSPLLETVAQELCGLIYGYDSRIKSITISVRKKHAPIPNIAGNVSVTYKQDF